MKKYLLTTLYLLALAFSANILADEEDYNEPEKKAEGQKEEEKPEGEVEEAKNGLQLREGNIDGLFLDTVAKEAHAAVQGEKQGSETETP
jgi:hypothetical protein